jgi:hypothetical protein
VQVVSGTLVTMSHDPGLPQVTPPSQTGKPASDVRRRGFRWLILVPILAFMALGCWAFASPIGSSPDEDFHLTSIWCAGGNQPGTCETTSVPAKRVVPEALVEAACYAHKPQTSGACQNAIDFHPSDTVVTARGSFLDNYPPIYYATMHVFVTPDIQVSVLLMRLVNILYFVGVSTVLWFLLPRYLRSAMVWSWVITTVPLGLFLIASVNPSSWAITGIGASWIALYAFFQTTGRRRIALAAVYAVTTFLAAGARGDAAIYCVLTAAVVVFLAFCPERRYFLGLILPAVLVVVAILFYVTSQQSGVVMTGLPEDTAGGTVPIPPKPSGASILVNNLLNSPSLVIGVFGSWQLGWLDTALPTVVWALAGAIFVGVVFVALRSSGWRKTVAVAGAAAVLWLLPVYVLQRSMSIVGTQVQPRYLLPLVVLFAGLALLPWGTRSWSLTSLQRWLIVGALAISQAVSLHYNMKRYITGVGNGGGLNLNSNPQWWWAALPVSPMIVWGVGVVAFAGLLVILARELRPFDGLRREVGPNQRDRDLTARSVA